MTVPPFIELDETDESIIELLRDDGRMPYRAMATALGLTEATVRSRVRRLEESNAMRVVAVTDFQAAGYEMMLAVGIQVDQRAPLEVAEALAGIPEVFSINLVIGTYDIEILVVAEDQAALAELIYQRLAMLPGVRRVVASLAVDVLKNQPDWVPLSSEAAPERSARKSRATATPERARSGTALPTGSGDRGRAASAPATAPGGERQGGGDLPPFLAMDAGAMPSGGQSR